MQNLSNLPGTIQEMGGNKQNKITAKNIKFHSSCLIKQIKIEFDLKKIKNCFSTNFFHLIYFFNALC